MHRLVALAAVSLCACVTKGNVVENLEAVPQDRGLVVFSTGADQKTAFHPLSLRLVDGSTLTIYDRFNLSLDTAYQSSTFAEDNARVRLLNLPEGTYYFLPHIASAFVIVTEGPVYRFTVRKNAVTYIGSFIRSGATLTWTGEHFDRDVGYFRGKNPRLASTRIELQKVEVAGDAGTFKPRSITLSMP